MIMSVLLVTVVLSGCGGNSEDVGKLQVRSMTKGSKAFLVKSDKELSQYFQNFQQAINDVAVSDLSEFIMTPDSTTKSYFEYLRDKDMKSLLKFYMAQVKLEFIETIELDGKQYAAVSVSYFDNRNNDFNRPKLIEGADPRAEFYDAVRNGIASSTEKGDQLVSEIQIAKSTSHVGWDYNTKSEVDEWSKKLTEHKDDLVRFNKTMLLQLVDGSEYTMVSLQSQDLMTLMGNLPVFFGLNSVYAIEDYSPFYNFTMWMQKREELETKMYQSWEKLDSWSDSEMKDRVVADLAPEDNGKVFGKYNPETDLDKIRQNMLPAELAVLMEQYYGEGIRSHFVYCHENPMFRKVTNKLLKSCEIELIEQSGKLYRVKVSIPDLTKCLLELDDSESWKGMNSEERLTQLDKKLDKKLDMTTVFVELGIQSKEQISWGFQMATVPARQVLLAVDTAVLKEIGLYEGLTARLNDDGFLKKGE